MRALLSISLTIAIGLLACLAADQARADAVMVSRAMFAETIAEYYVEEDGVRVELEIGPENIEAFRNLLPDEIYTRLGRDPEPMVERVERFFREDMVIVADDGEALPGGLLALEPTRREERDPITGESLGATGDERLALLARLFYPLAERPERLHLSGGPSTANVGFVAYHQGIAVNDFRYLGPSQTLLLDWGDPFYSHFERRALRRQYFAPMTGFIYVEPYEVRKEIVLRPRDLQSWLDLGLEGRTTIPVEMQPELERRVAEFLRERHVVRIDGEQPKPQLARVNFLERTLRTSRVIEPRRELDLNAATLGVIFVYPTNGLPQKVTMDWDLWSEKISQVPASSVDQAGPLPTILEPDWPVLEWQNFLKNPQLPTLQVVADPPGPIARLFWVARWPAVVVGLTGMVFAATRRRAGGALGLPSCVAGVGLVFALGGFGFTGAMQLSDARTQDVVAGLLHNVYRAFDYRDEGRIYDVLAQSVDGDLLEQIYLETRRGLVLASQGGARAKVKAVELDGLEIESAGTDGFVGRAVWNVRGSVGHWGHIHERSNRYRAALTVAPVEGRWKLVALDILEEERL